jgi:hypothetical protein
MKMTADNVLESAKAPMGTRHLARIDELFQFSSVFQVIYGNTTSLAMAFQVITW